MSDFHARKEERRRHYEQHVKGWKLRTCTACSGSGYYDNDGSPKCWSCSGTGKERARPEVGGAPK
jgi:DnaJ-class molecular chaperone